MGRWVTGCPRSGRHWGRLKGGWRPLHPSRGGRGRGSWLSMGGLSAGWWDVGFVHGLGYMIDLAAWAGRWACAVSTYLRWSRKLISFQFCVFHRHLYKLVIARTVLRLTILFLSLVRTKHLYKSVFRPLNCVHLWFVCAHVAKHFLPFSLYRITELIWNWKNKLRDCTVNLMLKICHALHFSLQMIHPEP